MEACELRIGNWVRKSDLLPAFQVIGKDIHDLERSNILALHPIPLLPEILEKAGFKQTGVDSLGGWFYYNIDGKMEVKSGAGGIHFEHGKAVTILHYVHELQNLYFALTGTDLSLQL